MADGDGGSGRSGNGCLTFLGIGCAGLLVLAAVGVGVLWFKGPELLQWAGAKMISVMSEAVLVDAGLPEDEAEAVQAPLAELADRVASGEIEIEQLEALPRYLFTAPPRAFGLAILRGFEHRYARRSDWYADEAVREANALSVNRFMRAARDGSVAEGVYGQIMQSLSVEQSQGGGEDKISIRLDKELARAEVDELLAQMEAAADAAAIDESYQPLDLPALMRGAIQAALAEHAAAGAADPAGEVEAAPVEPAL